MSNHSDVFRWNIQGKNGKELGLRARHTGEIWKDEFVKSSYRAMLRESAHETNRRYIFQPQHVCSTKQIQRRCNHLVIKPSSGPDEVENETVKWKWAGGKMSPNRVRFACVSCKKCKMILALMLERGKIDFACRHPNEHAVKSKINSYFIKVFLRHLHIDCTNRWVWAGLKIYSTKYV